MREGFGKRDVLQVNDTLKELVQGRAICSTFCLTCRDQHSFDEERYGEASDVVIVSEPMCEPFDEKKGIKERCDLASE